MGFWSSIQAATAQAAAEHDGVTVARPHSVVTDPNGGPAWLKVGAATAAAFLGPVGAAAGAAAKVDPSPRPAGLRGVSIQAARNPAQFMPLQPDRAFVSPMPPVITFTGAPVMPGPVVAQVDELERAAADQRQKNAVAVTLAAVGLFLLFR